MEDDDEGELRVMLKTCFMLRCTADDYVDYDSDYDAKTNPVKDVDPYAGEPSSTRYRKYYLIAT